MKIINFDCFVKEEATVIVNGKAYLLVEPTLYKWLEYSGKVGEKEDMTNEQLADFERWIIKTVIPDLNIMELTGTESNRITEICVKVLSGGIKELGKKLNPLEEMIKTL